MILFYFLCIIATHVIIVPSIEAEVYLVLIWGMRILGIDPGTRQMGWGILELDGEGKISMSAHGCLKVSAKGSFNDRLVQMASLTTGLIEKWQPHAAAIEKIFLGKNVDSAFKLGHIRGVCVVECQKQGAEIFEYSPREVKKSITGSGGSDKEVLRQYLYSQLGIVDEGETLDASDALALAFCHHLQQQVNARLKSLEGF